MRMTDLMKIINCKCRCGTEINAIVTKGPNFNEKWFVYCPDCYMSTTYYDTEEEAIKMWEKVMSQRKGRWIKHIDDLFPEESTEECSECHEMQFIWYGKCDKYCPNCGAKMENE